MEDESSRSDERWIDAALAEYEAHRGEVVAEAQAQQQILALGATAVGVVVAGAFNVWDDRLLATISFLLVVPLLSLFVLIQWAGRAAAMMRVGVYLEVLETAIGKALSAPAPVLTWERTLAGMRPQKLWTPQAGWNDFGAVGVFALLAAGSIALGAYRGWSGYEALMVIATVAEGAILIGTVLSIGSGVAQARKQARENFPHARSEADEPNSRREPV